MDMDVSDVEQIFQDFDTDQRGYITFEQFDQFCEEKGLPNGREIFETMDRNNDGMIEKSEFVNCFNSLIMEDSIESMTPGIVITCEEEEEDGIEPEPEPVVNDTNDNISNNNSIPLESQEIHRPTPDRLSEKSSTMRRRASTPRSSGLRSQSWHADRKKIKKSRSDIFTRDDGESIYASHQETWDAFTQSLGESFFALSSYDGIEQVYRSLESTGSAEILRNYETMVQCVVKEMAKIQKEMSEMEISYEKAKEISQQQQEALEEEMESQILKEKELRMEERRRADEESEMMKSQYERQIEQLQGAIKNLKKVDAKLSSISPYEKELDVMGEKIRRLNSENLSLKQKLTEAETNLIVLQQTVKEMEYTQQEKNIAFLRDEEEVVRVTEEREIISKEVESLYSSNRQLIDSNDHLREALEKTWKKSSRLYNGSVDRMNSPEHNKSGRSSRASILQMVELAECDPGRNNYPVHEFDSGTGTYRDELDDSETDWGEDSSRRGYRPNGSPRHNQDKLRRHGSFASYSSSRRSKSRRYNHRRRDDSDDFDDVTNMSDVTDDELRDISQSSTLSSGSRSRLSVPHTPGSTRKVITPDITLGHNKRMYKVVMCGDSGVGKTSFIYRACKNEFYGRTKSTLGVDFQMKTIQLEHDKSISLQIWDTAGQERFRSISASYFRRAEAVLLLYDCTNQTSFLNVRDWMETINDSVNPGTPVMICGHKVDLRDEAELSGKPIVGQQDGAQLSATYGVLFVETSALDGCNISNAVTMLARHIRLDDNEDTMSVRSLSQTPVVADRQCCKQS